MESASEVGNHAGETHAGSAGEAGARAVAAIRADRSALQDAKRAGVSGTVLAICAASASHRIVLELLHQVRSGAFGGWLCCAHPACVADSPFGTYSTLAGEEGARLIGPSLLHGDGGGPVRIWPLVEALGEQNLVEGSAALAEVERKRALGKRLAVVGRSAEFARLKALHDRADWAYDARMEYRAVLDATADRQLRALAQKKLKPIEAEVKALAKKIAGALAGFDEELVYDDRMTGWFPEKSQAYRVALVFDWSRALASDYGFLPPDPLARKEAA